MTTNSDVQITVNGHEVAWTYWEDGVLVAETRVQIPAGVDAEALFVGVTDEETGEAVLCDGDGKVHRLTAGGFPMEGT